MKREYYGLHSNVLGRRMEMLVFGHGGLPVIVFPTSCGRFYEFEDRGMVRALSGGIEAGRLQLYCVDSIDGESWYNRGVPPRWRIARQVQYTQHIVQEIVPFLRDRNRSAQLVTTGCSFGGYHALNLALQHPEIFTGCLTMSGAFDLEKFHFLNGYHDQDAYFNLPMNYMPNLSDGQVLDQMRRNTYVLATGVHDQCWNDNEKMAAILRGKGIAAQLYVWGNNTGHDWPWWQRMAQLYL